MSQDDSRQDGLNRERDDPRLNVLWTPAVSCSEGLDVILQPANKALFNALRAYVDVALLDRWPRLRSEDRDDLFQAAVVILLRKRQLAARFAYLFGESRTGQPGPLGPYLARTAKRLYLSQVRDAERAACRQQKLIERQKLMESTPSLLDVLAARDNLNMFGERLRKLLEAGRRIIHPRHWNALLEFFSARWPIQAGDLPPPWPDVVPASNQATRRSDRYRARAELTGMTPEYGFNEDQLALLRKLGVVHEGPASV